MKFLLITFLFYLMPFSLSAQDESKPIIILKSSRVDTSINEVREIVLLYENYLNSKPESINDNPYWNSREKKLYEDFDFSRASMFKGGLTANQLSQIFTPFIMSVEPIGEKYQIRVLFSSPNINPKFAGSKVWCIQKLNAIKENSNWVLENLIVELSEKWTTKIVGQIEYIFPPSYDFQISQANLSVQFCNTIIKRFNPTYNSSFKYYITHSIDDMGLIENFDYYFTGMTTGKTRKNMILSAKGKEYYPHEFVHQLLPPNKNRGYVIDEGLAVFLGTKMDSKEYENSLQKLACDLKQNTDKINFTSVVSQKVEFNGYQTAYPAGAAICELIYKTSGDKGLIQLMLANTSDYENIVATLLKITKLPLDKAVKEWNQIILKYNR
jgi:hypothetical protein